MKTETQNKQADFWRRIASQRHSNEAKLRSINAELLSQLYEAATLLESCRGVFLYQTAAGDKFAPDAAFEDPITRFLESYYAERVKRNAPLWVDADGNPHYANAEREA